MVAGVAKGLVLAALLRAGGAQTPCSADDDCAGCTHRDFYESGEMVCRGAPPANAALACRFVTDEMTGAQVCWAEGDSCFDYGTEGEAGGCTRGGDGGHKALCPPSLQAYMCHRAGI